VAGITACESTVRIDDNTLKDLRAVWDVGYLSCGLTIRDVDGKTAGAGMQPTQCVLQYLLGRQLELWSSAKQPYAAVKQLQQAVPV
jgi:hypothetical protein